VIGEQHDSFLRKFYDNPTTHYDERVIIGIHNNGYLMPLMINTNVVTKYDEGILIIGLINPSKYFGKLRADDENMPIN